jgi:Phosphotransferase enzyme family
LSPPTDPSPKPEKIDIAANLQRLAALPDWLRAALDAEQVADALRRSVPEFASGALTLRGAKIKRLLLKDDDGRWSGIYNLTVEEPGSGEKRTVALRGTLTAPRLRAANGGEQHPQVAFGAESWRCMLPELGLELQPEPPDAALAALPQLTEPEQARVLLEQSIRQRSPAYADIRIATCTPEVLSYKPGSRCVIRYHLEYPPELADRGWPATVIAKTYRKDSKAKNAFDGMLALWSSPLANGDVVTIAEPLAYVSDLKLMVQAPIAEELTLEDLLKSALREGTPERLEELYVYTRKAAAGLAALHQLGTRHSEMSAMKERFPDIRELIGRLVVPVPELGQAATPLLQRLEAYAAAHPAGTLVPTHGAFHPEQVLIHQGRIGFIDFDDFGMAEPALDVGMFCSSIRDTGMATGDDDSRETRRARLAQIDAICDVFVSEYAAHMPIARERVELWQALDCLRNCLHYWTKVKPAEPDTPMLVLEHLLRGMGLYAAPTITSRSNRSASANSSMDDTPALQTSPVDTGSE